MKLNLPAGALCVIIGLMASATLADEARSEALAGDPYAQETKAERDARMQWWREARFGMFIHWGIYSVPAGTYKGEPVRGIG